MFEQLDQASLGMPDRSYLLRGLNDSAVAGYYKLMVESAIILGANRTTAEEQMLEALKFETVLANVTKFISSLIIIITTHFSNLVFFASRRKKKY
jgi:predicted metalloendopeptidase